MELQRIDRTIRKRPKLFACANDYVVMNHFQHQVHSAAIGVSHAISWAHGENYGRPKPPPIPAPPETQECPHCKSLLPFTFAGINCPDCGKRLREPNAFVELFSKGHTQAHKEVLADIDATE